MIGLSRTSSLFLPGAIPVTGTTVVQGDCDANRQEHGKYSGEKDDIVRNKPPDGPRGSVMDRLHRLFGPGRRCRTGLCLQADQAECG
jgi:hypothetical protein